MCVSVYTNIYICLYLGVQKVITFYQQHQFGKIYHSILNLVFVNLTDNPTLGLNAVKFSCPINQEKEERFFYILHIQ